MEEYKTEFDIKIIQEKNREIILNNNLSSAKILSLISLAISLFSIGLIVLKRLL